MESARRCFWGLSYMLVGYMRVLSVDDRQSVDLQRDALVAAGSIIDISIPTRHPARVTIDED